MTFVLARKQPPIRSQLKIELYKLIVARSDIDASRTACKQLIENTFGMGDGLYYPLYCAIVICYSRPFTQNKPYGAIGNRWKKYTNQRFNDIHKKILKARNEIIAHSELQIREASIIPPNVESGEFEGKKLKSEKIGT